MARPGLGTGDTTISDRRTPIPDHARKSRNEAGSHHARRSDVSRKWRKDVALVRTRGQSRVRINEAAQCERFLGSPTVRVAGHDVDAGAEQRDDYGMKCRLYATEHGLRGTPPDAWILSALADGGSPTDD